MKPSQRVSDLDAPSGGPRFQLFGRFVGTVDAKEVLGFGGRKMQQLLAYLILFNERPHHREALADAIWSGEDGGTDPKKQLRQALWQLRLLLRTTTLGTPLLLVEDEWLQVNPKADVWADVWVIDEEYSAFRGMPGGVLEGDQAHRLSLAADLYRADLLEGWYADWCVFERERLKAVYLSSLDKLLVYCETHGLPEEGLYYGERILAHDRAHERTHARMMRLHVLAGDRTRALRQFHRCAVALKEELGVEPSESTVSLLDRIRREVSLSFP